MMDSRELTSTSRFLSLVLRHKPETIGVTLDASGWVSVEALLQGMAAQRRILTRQQLEFVVEKNDKQRFEFDAERRMIRASQGHSVAVELGYQPAVPPAILYHGTVERFLDSINRSGLLKGERHHVHLHDDISVARQVGQRRGRPVILRVDARAMADSGIEFFQSANGVWLVDTVPPEFLTLLEAQPQETSE